MSGGEDAVDGKLVVDVEDDSLDVDPGEVDLGKMQRSLSGYMNVVTRRRKALDRSIAQHKERPSATSLLCMTELSAI